MKITPLEIRKKTFERVFRGYEKEEVDAFLQSLSLEWERTMEDQRELKAKLEVAEREVQKLREVESSLFKTLKTAEETGQNLVEQANKTAGLMTREAQMNADVLLNEAKQQSKNLIEQAEEKSKIIIDDAHEKVREFRREIKNIENQKDNLLLELRNLANDTLERVNKLAGKPGTLFQHTELSATKPIHSNDTVSKHTEHPPLPNKPLTEKPAEQPLSAQHNLESTRETSVPITSDTKSEGSFFDQFR